MTTGAHKPDRALADPKELLLGFLDYYRSVIIRKFEGLPDAELRASRLPSGWTPLELLKHLVFMEQRWLRWGFCGEQTAAPASKSAITHRCGRAWPGSSIILLA